MPPGIDHHIGATYTQISVGPSRVDGNGASRSWSWTIVAPWARVAASLSGAWLVAVAVCILGTVALFMAESRTMRPPPTPLPVAGPPPRPTSLPPPAVMPTPFPTLNLTPAISTEPTPTLRPLPSLVVTFPPLPTPEPRTQGKVDPALYERAAAAQGGTLTQYEREFYSIRDGLMLVTIQTDAAGAAATIGAVESLGGRIESRIDIHGAVFLGAHVPLARLVDLESIPSIHLVYLSPGLLQHSAPNYAPAEPPTRALADMSRYARNPSEEGDAGWGSRAPYRSPTTPSRQTGAPHAAAR